MGGNKKIRGVNYVQDVQCSGKFYIGGGGLRLI